MAVGVCCDRAEKSSLISQSLPLPLNLSPPSFLPFLLARLLSRSLSLLPVSPGEFQSLNAAGVTLGNLNPEPVYTHIHAHARTHARTHALALAHTHFSSAPRDTAQTFIYLKWTPRPDTSSLVFSGGQSNIGTRAACWPVRNLTPFTATPA